MLIPLSLDQTKPVFQLAPAPGPKRVPNGATPMSASAALSLVASSSASTSANVTFPGTTNGLAGSTSAPYRLGGQGPPSASGAFVNRSISPNFSSSPARAPVNGVFTSPSRTQLNNSVFALPSTAQNAPSRPFPQTADGAQGTASPRGTPTRKGSFGLLRGLKISLSSPNLRAAFRGGESPSPAGVGSGELCAPLDLRAFCAYAIPFCRSRLKPRAIVHRARPIHLARPRCRRDSPERLCLMTEYAPPGLTAQYPATAHRVHCNRARVFGGQLRAFTPLCAPAIHPISVP